MVVLTEQVCAAGDLTLRRFLTRIRQGVQDRSDVDILNSMWYREGRRIPWEMGITVVTPLNRNRWNLNVEAVLPFQRRRQGTGLQSYSTKQIWDRQGLLRQYHDGERASKLSVVALISSTYHS